MIGTSVMKELISIVIFSKLFFEAFVAFFRDMIFYPFSMYAKISNKLMFYTLCYAQVCLRNRGKEMLTFRNILHTYWMGDPQSKFENFTWSPLEWER